jgi:hypothetical protein
MDKLRVMTWVSGLVLVVGVLGAVGVAIVARMSAVVARVIDQVAADFGMVAESRCTLRSWHSLVERIDHDQPRAEDVRTEDLVRF